jgi:hypothetical protein
VNDTTIAGTIDLNATVQGNLIDGAKGDRVMVTQLVGATSNGVPYQHLLLAATLGSFTIADGSSASASGTLSGAAIASALPVNWVRSQFAVLRGYVNPQAADDYQIIDVFAQPGGLAHGSFSYAPDLALALPPAGSTDLTLSMQFGDPFPSSWPLGIATSSNFFVNYTAAGASATAFDGAIASQTALVGAPPAIVPIVSPVRAPTVNGVDAFTERTGVGLTPQVAWTAPSLGTPSSYAVHVRAIVNASGATRFNYAGSVYTRDTSVTLPPGLLASGQRYFFVVTAYSEPVDFDATPLQDAYPLGFAEALLAPVTP